jgi:hypothetical protein
MSIKERTKQNDMDELYIDKVCSGDTNSFRYFLIKYKDMAFSIAISVIKDEFFAEEVVSPTLKIIVPENYTGQVSLIKSNVTENILTVDSNGIGYLNKWTFNKLYSKPIVVGENGKDLTKQCVGFNP